MLLNYHYYYHCLLKRCPIKTHVSPSVSMRYHREGSDIQRNNHKVGRDLFWSASSHNKHHTLGFCDVV